MIDVMIRRDVVEWSAARGRVSAQAWKRQRCSGKCGEDFMIKSRGLGGAGVWLRKLARLAETYAVSALEPGEPAVAE